jgi:hypothetical protein
MKIISPLLEINAMASLIPILFLLILGIAIYVLIVRWVFRIDTIVSSQKAQNTKLDEVISQLKQLNENRS